MGSKTEQALQIKSKPPARATVCLALQKHESFIRAYASFDFHVALERQGLKIRQNYSVSVGEAVKSLFLVQVEELKNVPSNSEKAISKATSEKELLEKTKEKEEEKLKQVMDSLKEETQGLQEEKEV